MRDPRNNWAPLKGRWLWWLVLLLLAVGTIAAGYVAYRAVSGGSVLP